MKRTCQCGNSCNFKQTVYGNENTETWVQDTVPFLLPVIANTEKRKTFSRLFSFPWKLNHLCSPQVITYTPICTHMFSYTDRLSDLSPSLMQSHHYCCVSALHFSEITCQSKHTSSIYSWCLIVYAGFTSRHIEPLMLNISELHFSQTEPYTRCFLPWIKLPWDQTSAVSFPVHRQTFIISIIIIVCGLIWHKMQQYGCT